MPLNTPDMQSLADRFFYTGKREYTVVKGDIAYLDDAPLRRPFTLPAAQRMVLIGIIVIAAIIGFMAINNTVFAAMRESKAIEVSTEENLKRAPSIDSIPQMNNLINLTDEEVMSTFEEAGYTMYTSAKSSDSSETVMYKLPSDISREEAAAMYVQGINSLNSAQAAKLLTGSWYFGIDRVNGTSMIVRYADFSTGDPQIAVQNALAKEGFDPASVTDSGEDESGNKYSMGTINVDDVPCTWKISALPLSDIYSVSGLPENACYVGVRMTKA